MTTETDICNLALDLLKEAQITSIGDDRPIARWLKRNYPIQRDGLMKRHDWNFAMRRGSAAADTVLPAFGWSFAYTLPSDCLRLLPLTIDGSDEGAMIPHVVEGGKVLTNLGAPLLFRFVAREVTTGLFTPEFIEALSARLAARMAHWLTGKSGYVQIAKALYDEAIKDAWALDAMEGTVPRAADDEWTNAR